MGPSRAERVGRLSLLAYVVLMPLAHLGRLPIFGAAATAADLLLALLLPIGALSAWVTTSGRMRRSRWRARPVAAALLLLSAYVAWTGLAVLWSPSAGYALAKLAGAVALLALVLWIVLGSASSEALADAWLLGLGFSLLAALLLSVGPEAARGLAWERGGVLADVWIPRLRGTFGHPNLLGGYLLVSLPILWARWDVGRRPAPWALWGLLTGAVAALVLTASGAWLGVGALLVLWAAKQRAAPLGRRILVGLAGLLGASIVMAVTVHPFIAAALRPEIWRRAFAAFLESPMVGIGLVRHVAELADPRLFGGASRQWSAHSLYLGHLAQLGLVGLGLFGAAMAGVLRATARGGRVGAACAAAVVGILVYGVIIDAESFRFWWAVMGIGLLAAREQVARDREGVCGADTGSPGPRA